MQTVSAAFTAAEKAPFRSIADSLLVSWHRQTITSARTFTIGVSTIGGSDFIGINPGAVGSPGNYKYFDESAYLISLGWERGYNMPQGGLSMALGEAVLDNTSGRFTPRFIGGNSELSTAILPRRPVMINAGFHHDGIDDNIPQFAGIVSTQPEVNMRQRTVSLQMMDYIGYFQNKYLDKVVMFTGQSTDVVLESLFVKLGMSTAQYSLDQGINIIPFGIFDVNTKFSDAIGQLVEAENGHLYQDESGIIRFENRQHWITGNANTVQKIITTAMVIDQQILDSQHIVNSVEVRSNVRQKQPSQLVFTLGTVQILQPGQSTEFFVQFNDPILALDTPAFWLANTNPDGTSGDDVTTSVSFQALDLFAQSAKIKFYNSYTNPVYLTGLNLYGRPAQVTTQIDYQAKDGASVTAYQEQPLSIDNDFIQSQDWAQTYAQMMLNDFADPSKLQQITVRAIPELQMGDLISWQGQYWRVYDIKTRLDPSVGFTQELLLLQRTINSYFRIGISTIGGTDQISP
jgi:hypothetical protein